jgi:hypothetical protein
MLTKCLTPPTSLERRFATVSPWNPRLRHAKESEPHFREVRSNRFGDLFESALLSAHAAWACMPSVNAACLPACSACLASRTP